MKCFVLNYWDFPELISLYIKYSIYFHCFFRVILIILVFVCFEKLQHTVQSACIFHYKVNEAMGFRRFTVRKKGGINLTLLLMCGRYTT